MKIADAAELHTTWAARFNAKDLDGMVALAETDSVFVPQTISSSRALYSSWIFCRSREIVARPDTEIHSRVRSL